MKSFKSIFAILCLAFFMHGCIYANVGTPLDRNVNNTVLGSKVGEAHTHSIAGIVAWGDSGTAAAAKNGGITTITHLDAKYLIYFFGIYSRVTTVAYGN